MSADDEKKEKPSSIIAEDEQRFIDQLSKAESAHEVESKNLEGEDRKNMKPLHSSTPLVLSPNSVNGRHHSRSISGHSVVSTIYKSTSGGLNGRKESGSVQARVYF